MMFPELEYYNLIQLAAKWDVCVSHIRHYVETGKLACACWLDKCAVHYGRWIENAQGFELFEPSRLDVYHGFVGVNHVDARLAFHHGMVNQPHFYSLEDKEAALRLVKESDFTLTEKDLYVMRREVELFEEAFMNVSKTASVLRFSDDCQTIYHSGRSHRLGEIQANVMKQLVESAKTENPWIHGKQLLKKCWF